MKVEPFLFCSTALCFVSIESTYSKRGYNQEVR